MATASIKEDSAEVATTTRKEGTLIEVTIEIVNIREDSTKKSTISIKKLGCWSTKHFIEEY